MLLGIAGLNGLIGIKRIAESFFPPSIYRKDFISPYLMGKAILNGADPYLPLHELANLWMSYANYSELKHPTPHPPVVGALFWVFGFLSYETAAVAWLVIELTCLLAAILLALRWWGTPIRIAPVAVLFVIALGWMPVIEDLYLGQFTICLLLLLIGAWIALREERNLFGGALLGGLIALKLTAWPLVLFLLLRRKWDGALAAGTVVIAANLLAMAVLGVDRMKEYYFKIGPAVASIYRSHDVNFSTWTFSQRLFAGTGYNFVSPPLWASPSLARLCLWFAPATVLLLGLWLALKARDFDTSFGLLTGASILLNPIAWAHYLILASIPIMIIARKLQVERFPRRITHLAFTLWLMLSIAGTTYSYAAMRFAAKTAPNGLMVVPFAAGLLTLFPVAALAGLLWLVWRLDGIELSQDNKVDPNHEIGEFLETGATQAI